MTDNILTSKQESAGSVPLHFSRVHAHTLDYQHGSHHRELEGFRPAEELDPTSCGAVAGSQCYRVAELRTLIEYQDIVFDSLVIIDAPEGVNAITRVQQALTSTRGPAENNEAGLLTWEVGTKTVTLHPQPGDATRASLHVSDSYQLPEVMQVYNRP